MNLHLRLLYWHYHHNKITMFCKTSKLYLWNLCHISFELMSCSRFHTFIICTLPQKLGLCLWITQQVSLFIVRVCHSVRMGAAPSCLVPRTCMWPGVRKLKRPAHATCAIQLKHLWHIHIVTQTLQYNKHIYH